MSEHEVSEFDGAEEWFGSEEAARRNIPREGLPGRGAAWPCATAHTHGFACTLAPGHEEWGASLHRAEGRDLVVAEWKTGGQYDAGFTWTPATLALFASGIDPRDGSPLA